MTTEHVILVDESDRAIGTSEKLAAHQDGGRLHRAFSIFLFDSANRLLLQQRAACKYHFPLRWSNTCCGHPRPSEQVVDAARRRLREELGISTDLRGAAQLQYRAVDPATGLTEHEFLHVLVGAFDGEPCPSPNEIAAYRWETLDAVEAELASAADQFSPWFPIALRAIRNTL
ncbi:MAG: isopentenyl-diphosphate Delta-isomerase [Phycisphaerales bacterium]|nr:isopentenyl-diphosphate Delta-isomerase [Phycisphaerales bacterium]MCB9864179.1 isopentenyl-diphosphate Delta-isomerase [Phycisphaerales bacterium]